MRSIKPVLLAALVIAAFIIFPAVAAEDDPDLQVISLGINLPKGKEVFHNGTNTYTAVISNNGTTVAGTSIASLSIDGLEVATVNVPALNPDETATVELTDPASRIADTLLTIDVTADSAGTVTEADETNNVYSVDKTVVNNGYRGKRWTDSTNPDIETVIDWQGPGNCLYSAGDSVYKSGYSGWAEPDYTVSWTDNDLPVRAGAVTEETRLYVYYTFDYKDTISNSNYTLTFNGEDLTGIEDAAYSDRKGFGSYNYNSGVLIYDVTGIFDSSGNSATFTNNEDLTQNKQISLHGCMLVTIYSYEGAQDIHVILNEGYDQLYVNPDYHVSSDETYAYAPFDSLDYEDGVSATLVTFVPAGIAPEGALWINGDKVADNAWSAPADALHQIGVNSFDATEQIRNGDNIVAFQQTGNKETMFAANAILILGAPDLQVLSVGVNLPKGKEVFHNGTNTYTAVISNNGTTVAGTSVASLSINGVEMATADVPALNPNETATVELTDPTNRIAETLLAIDVTADSAGTVTEADETNNVYSVEKTVVNNGYRGKRWTDSTNPDIETVIDWQGPGNCLYSAGDSVYKSGYSGWAEPDYTVSWTDTDLPVPADATIEETRLYVYYTFDYKDTISNDNYTLTFNGDDLTGTEAAAYSDRKGFGSYNYKSGALIYDVTGIFDSSGNSAIFTNNEDLTQNKQISIHGCMLVTIYSYEGAEDIQVILNEGYDQLYVNQDYHVSANETYAYAPFDSLNYEDGVCATLVTFVPAGIAPEGALWINGDKVADDAWSAPPGALHQIGINSFDATEQITNGDNLVAFQQTGNKETMFAANAILILGSPDAAGPDLQVLSAGINLPKGKEVFHNGTNTYTAVISNNGTAASGTSVASLSINGVEMATTDVPALNPDETATVELRDATSRITGTLLTIDVTADSAGTVTESDETNNVYSVDKTVVNNGYRGKRWTDSTNPDIDTVIDWQGSGNCLYSAGDSVYKSGYSGWSEPDYTVSWTDANLPVPADATIEETRLYVYYTFDYKDTISNDNYTLAFNGNDLTGIEDATYSDRKGFGSYNYKSGVLIYNVTDIFDSSGNSAIFTNNEDLTQNKQISIHGCMLVTIYSYEGAQDIHVILNEGYDQLYVNPDYHVSANETYAYAPFDSLNSENDVCATLVTFVPAGIAPEGALWINGDKVADNAWSAPPDALHQIGVNSFDATEQITNGDNIVAFQQTGNKETMFAANAILILRSPDAVAHLKNGWNFISTPRSLMDGQNTAEEVFSGVTTGDYRIYQYDASVDSMVSMEASDVVNPLEGIWVHSDGTADIPFWFGDEACSQPYTKTLYAGWNSIGHPGKEKAGHETALSATSGAWTQVTGFNPATQMYYTSVVRGGTGIYGEADKFMYPTEGYWVFVSKNTQLTTI